MSRLIYSRLFHFCILFILLILSVYYSNSGHILRKKLQYAVFDQYNEIYKRPPTEDILIVDIDEASLSHLGQWPWPRTVMADLITRLKGMGASVVTFDMVFAEADRTSPGYMAARLPEGDDYVDLKTKISSLPNHDDVFSAAIKEAGNVVTGFVIADQSTTRSDPLLKRPLRFLPPAKADEMRAQFGNFTTYPQNLVANLENIDKAAAGSGHFIAEPDVDGIIRKVSLFAQHQAAGSDKPDLYPALSVETLRVFVDPRSENQIRLIKEEERQNLGTSYTLRIGQKFDVPIEPDSQFWVHYRDIGKSEYLSAYKILSPEFEKEVREKIDGKIVFVGTSAIGLKDIRATPLSLSIPGVEVHVNIVEQIMQKKFMVRPPLVAGAEAWSILAVGLLIIISAPFLNALIVGMFALIAAAGGFFLSWHAYTQWGVLLDPAYPAFSVFMIFLVSTLLSYIRIEADRRRVKNAFGYYISPDFMEELTRNPEKLALGGETRELTVMFTDIRNFTTISESLAPAELIQLMNDFLTPMSDLVMQNRGTIDKFMGDAMMAFWNAPLDDPDHARHACLTALKMNEALKPINMKLKKDAEAKGLTPLVLQAGIGVNTGPVSVGNMGSRQRFAYSALGDNVNLASRLEGQTKSYGVDNLIGMETQLRVSDLATLELDLLRVKGKSAPVRIFTLIGDENVALSDEFIKWKNAHDQMLSNYRQQKFDEANDCIQKCCDLSGGRLSAYYEIFRSRIEDMKKHRPGDGWDGVFIATSK
ncbi:MAG: CHASE2 domain-containing protein [Micavibrio sp.]